MDQEKRDEIKAILLKEWDSYPDKTKLANMVIEGYIFGKYAHSEHYLIEDILPIVQEIEKEKTPVAKENENEIIFPDEEIM
jgi:hypothetical protein